jgi:hypothetical protein
MGSSFFPKFPTIANVFLINGEVGRIFELIKFVFLFVKYLVLKNFPELLTNFKIGH